MDDWRDKASCATGDAAPELFDAEDWHSAKAARDICNACPVANMCLEYALATDQQHGIWGGLTPLERKTLLRRARA